MSEPVRFPAAFVDLDNGVTYRVTFSDVGDVSVVCRRLHHGDGPDLKPGGTTWRAVMKAYREQLARGGRGRV